ncbi:uncharacterized protein LOC120111681 [Phoenix dactylifera]|uniref:Uncharacterized protein LOC120111681 n=1 Tax=Phoenix dactylifera TaxID=42345 RepID=A0A8B9AQ06_PHODC|nr:uncharacterized protein LOC120111681 [Phoenix dactylifera]
MDRKGKQPATKATEEAARGKGKPTAAWSKPMGRGVRPSAWSRPGPWVTHWPTAEEVDRLSRRFPEVLRPPEEPIEAARQVWEGRAAIVRSFGRRIPAEWVAKDVATRAKLEGVVAVPLADEYIALRFRSTEDRDRALREGPWVVAGQLLAMSPWVPDFEPGDGTVNRALVWLRLPRLPPKYWSTSTILHIAARAGQPVAVDEVTEQQAAMGFARIKVAIDPTEPLRPGVLIQGKTKVRWQPFVFENVPVLCPSCGRMGHTEVTCRFRTATGAHREVHPVATEAGDNPDLPPFDGGEEVQGPVYGPWMVGRRSRELPPRPKEPPGADLGAGSSARRPVSPVVPASSPATVSPADTAGWQKPAKVARRRSPVAAEGEGLQLALPPGPF